MTDCGYQANNRMHGGEVRVGGSCAGLLPSWPPCAFPLMKWDSTDVPSPAKLNLPACVALKAPELRYRPILKCPWLKIEGSRFAADEFTPQNLSEKLWPSVGLC